MLTGQLVQRLRLFYWSKTIFVRLLPLSDEPSERLLIACYEIGLLLTACYEIGLLLTACYEIGLLLTACYEIGLL